MDCAEEDAKSAVGSEAGGKMAAPLSAECLLSARSTSALCSLFPVTLPGGLVSPAYRDREGLGASPGAEH